MSEFTPRIHVEPDLFTCNNIRLIILPRRNQEHQVPPEAKRSVNAVRQLIETLNGQLTEQFLFK